MHPKTDIIVTRQGGKYVGQCSFENRGVLKNAGFRFDAKAKHWYTKELRVAARLRDYVDTPTKKILDKKLISISPWQAAIPYPKELTPYPFQIDVAAPYALARNRSYLGIDPGCGKTIIAAMCINALMTEKVCATAIYVCPPFLVPNVIDELEKWKTFRLNVTKYERRTNMTEYGVIVLPDSMLKTSNIDELDAFINGVTMFGDVALIVDEAHRFKSDKSQRSKCLYTHLLPKFKRAIFMSGTPMPNKPMELFPVIHHAAPEVIDFMTKFQYGFKYCGAKKGPFGWTFDGAANMDTLTSNLRDKFLLRIKKGDVLKDLPPKTESVVFLDAKYPPKLAALDRQIVATHSPKDLVKHMLGDSHVATYRKDLGAFKLKYAVTFLRGILEDSNESVLVFAHHKEVISGLMHDLAKYHPLEISGRIPTDERARRAVEFQNNPMHRVMVLNIQAGGIGFNLTKASRVVFVEFSWVPSDNEQAIDRAHRIKQTLPVFAQYLVYRHSIDSKILLMNLKKRSVTQQL